ncbi:elastin-like isoform X3 [Onychostruthus taczanowskii]|uniref:elastin-like isoform X3 n=1 Tax=Onychostruthus taczanowskii TaxID=356909 RepID=UPI001B7FFE97|nr:elastin-like isoform X3 [Onychostruthus taczanowskii]
MGRRPNLLRDGHRHVRGGTQVCQVTPHVHLKAPRCPRCVPRCARCPQVSIGRFPAVPSVSPCVPGVSQLSPGVSQVCPRCPRCPLGGFLVSPAVPGVSRVCPRCVPAVPGVSQLSQVCPRCVPGVSAAAGAPRVPQPQPLAELAVAAPVPAQLCPRCVPAVPGVSQVSPGVPGVSQVCPRCVSSGGRSPGTAAGAPRGTRGSGAGSGPARPRCVPGVHWEVSWCPQVCPRCVSAAAGAPRVPQPEPLAELAVAAPVPAQLWPRCVPGVSPPVPAVPSCPRCVPGVPRCPRCVPGVSQVSQQRRALPGYRSRSPWRNSR